MKKIVFILCIIIVFNSIVQAVGEEQFRLDGLINPESLSVDSTNVYVSDGATVNIFSRKNYKLIKRFGRKGDGPKEFALFSDRGIRLYLTEDRILVNSVMKLSFWTKQGEFIKSIKPKIFSALYIPLRGKYIGSGRTEKNKIRYKTVNIYNSSLEPVKEIMRSKEAFQPGRGLSIGGDNNYIFEVGKNKIFCCNSNNFEIEVFDENGNKINDIKRDFKRKKISKEERSVIINYLKTDPKFKDIYNMLKPITFADYFPAIDSIKYNDGKLYVISTTAGEKQEITVLRTDGTFIKKLQIPMKYKNSLKQLYPFVIESGKLLQLVEDVDDEEWDLLVFDLGISL